AVQAPVTALVQEMVAKEGESQGTTRKVQAMAAQIRKFLDPAHWDPPVGEVLRPDSRNRLWLVKRLVEQLPAERAAAVLALRYDDESWRKNLLGVKPVSLVDGYTYADILKALGDPARGDHWQREAAAAGKTCANCILA